MRSSCSRARRGLTAAAAAVAVITALALSAGPASAAIAGPQAAAPSPGSAVPYATPPAPDLTTNTPAACNAPPAAGHVQCFAMVRTPADHDFTPDAAGPPAGSLGPAQIQAAYHLPSGGAGQTVAVIDWGDDASAEPDLAVFRTQFGLPPCTTANGCFTKVNQQGKQGSYPADQGAGVEISLDLDAVSAACPDCKILLVEANSSAITAVGNAVDEAVTLGADFISNSYGTGTAAGGEAETAAETADDRFYNHPGVVVTASAGDGGFGVGYPAADPDVVSVGGTGLTADASVPRGWQESVWGDGTQGVKGDGTGSGCSKFEPQPSWQSAVAALTAACPAGRAVADLSADADPASGLAVYDTDPNDSIGGWVKAGGTSLAAPLVTAMYALAGAPQAGTYPVTYPYADPGQAGDLNDVTAGSNGTCGTAACNAGPGWDGPTGLGTPDGVGALASGPHGVIAGTVTDAATGNPLAGATVTAGQDAALTGRSGSYSLSVPAGTYSVSVSAFDYATATAGGVSVTAGATVTRNAALTRVPSVTLRGKVTDGSGQGWGLHAAITIAGVPGAPVWTNPQTGAYSVRLPEHATYQLSVATDEGGYQALSDAVTVGTAGLTRNFALPVDTTACEAPGYQLTSGLSQNFDNYPGAGSTTPPPGWTIQDNAGDGEVWQFNDPQGTGNLTGGSGNFAVLDSQQFGDGFTQDSSLISPVFSLAGDASPVLQFSNDYFGFVDQSASVDVSTDGGQTWTTIWSQTTASVRGPGVQQVAVPQAAGQSDVRIRFHFTSTLFGNWWQIDNVQIGTLNCAAVPGGMVTGQTTDANTGRSLNGVTVTVAGPTAVTATSAPSGDPAVATGYFSLFSPRTGRQHVTAALADSSYHAGAGTVTVRRGASVRAVLALPAGRLAVTPSALTAATVLGGRASAKLTITNTGTAPATVTLDERGGLRQLPGAGAPLHTRPAGAAVGVRADPGDGRGSAAGDPNSPATPPAGATPAAAAPSSTAPAAAVTGTWSAIAPYPTPVEDNGADFINGQEYSVGGINQTGALLDAGYAYNPAQNTWSPIATMPIARQKPSVVADLNNKLYVTGGWTARGVPIAETDVYDPASNTWRTLTPNPAPTAAAGTGDVNGVLYFVGGCLDGVCDTTAGVETYDVESGAWAAAAPYPHPVAWLSCGAIDSKLYCAGGTDSVSTFADAYVYDPAQNTWSPVASMPAGMWGSASGAADGMLIVSTGVTGGGAVITNQGFAYDPAANTWSAVPNALTAVYRSAGSCGFYSVGGSTGFLDQAGSQVLSGLTQCGTADVPWLTPAATTLTVRPGQRVQVSVAMSATSADQVSQPGTYTAQLGFSTDTPYDVSPRNVTMKVTPPKGWGQVTGTLSGEDCSGVTSPLPGTVAASGPHRLQFTAPAGESGRYEFWGPAGTWSLQASASGWIAAAQSVRISQGRTQSADITLTPATC